jgi:predicted Zn finger-like uncharacterized protein
MEVRCERCRTQYELDDSRISETGVTVQCTHCHHVFVVKKKALVVTVPVPPGQPQAPTAPGAGAPATPAPPGLRPLSPPINMPPPVATATSSAEPSASSLPPGAAPGEKAREWRVRQASGNVFTLKDLTTLQKWIVERKVSRDDEISLTGESWKRLGDIAELATFFQVVDEAQKAAVLQAQLGLMPGAAPPGALQGAQPTLRSPVPAVGAPPAQPVALQRKGSRLPVILLLLLALAGAGGAFYYLQVYLPRQEEEARRVAAARRLEDERREQERQERLLAAQAQGAAEGGGMAAPPEDGGALAGVGLPEAGDGGVPEDAGTALEVAAEAGMGADAGSLDAGAAAVAGAAADAGTPGVKRPAPVRDFDYYMAQGDRLRDRERIEAALDAYAEAAELEPQRAEPYAGRGMAFLDKGDTRQAEAEFKQALKLNPRYGEAIMGLAETYRSRGKKAEAVQYYERYLELLPNGPEAAVARSAIQRLKE